MAQPNAPFGFKVVGHVFNAVPQTRMYRVPATDGTALFVGDLVKTTTGGGDTATGVRDVIAAAAGDTILGVVVGILMPSTAQSLAIGTHYRPASTAQYLLVCDDPNVLLEAMTLSTGAGSTHILTIADIGKNADMEAGAGGSTLTGTSSMSIDASTVNTTQKQFRLMSVVNDSTNLADLVAGLDYVRVIVKPDKHELISTTGV